MLEVEGELLQLFVKKNFFSFTMNYSQKMGFLEGGGIDYILSEMN